MTNMPYGKIIMDNGAEILFQVEGPYVGQVSDEGIIHSLQTKFSTVLDIIKETAINSYTGLQKIPEHAKPQEFEILFGVTITAEAGAVFAKMGSGGTFEVTLRWQLE
jgi:hypothetical protein